MDEVLKQFVHLQEMKMRNAPTNKTITSQLKHAEEQIKLYMIEHKETCIAVGPKHFAVLKTVLVPPKVNVTDFTQLLQSWMQSRRMPAFSQEDIAQLVQFIEMNKQQLAEPKQVLEITTRKPVAMFLKPME